jgi:hypothetical protein
MLKMLSKMIARCRNWSLFLKRKDTKNRQTLLIDSDSTFGTTNHFPESTEEEYELLTARRESTRS